MYNVGMSLGLILLVSTHLPNIQVNEAWLPAHPDSIIEKNLTHWTLSHISRAYHKNLQQMMGRATCKGYMVYYTFPTQYSTKSHQVACMVMLQSGTTRSLVAKFVQSSFAVRKFRAAEEKCSKRGHRQMCANLWCLMLCPPKCIRIIAAQQTYFGFTTQEHGRRWHGEP